MRNRFGIRKGEKVLDVGCGAHPFYLATHLADKSLTDNSERFGPIPPTHLPLYECSVESMPFKDAEFDFVYCSHVLEHVVDPAGACRELMRVGKRGYIECPRSWMEYPFHSPSHRWLVDHEQHCLIFREKLEEEKRDFLGIQYALFSLLKDERFCAYWDLPEIKAVRNVEFYWEGSFDFVVIPKEERKNGGAFKQFYSAPYSDKATAKHSDLRQFLYSEFRRLQKP